GLVRRRAAARRYLDRRDHAAADHDAFRRAAGPLSLYRPAGRRRAPHRGGRHPAGGYQRDRGGQAPWQGLIARAQPHGGKIGQPAPAPRASAAAEPPRTLFEKIVRRHLLATPVTPADPGQGDGVFIQADWRFIHEYYTGMAAHLLRGRFGRQPRLVDPARIVVFEDHTSYVEESPNHVRMGIVPQVRAMCQAQRDFVRTHGLRQHRTLTEAEAARDAGGNASVISYAL